MTTVYLLADFEEGTAGAAVPATGSIHSSDNTVYSTDAHSGSLSAEVGSDPAGQIVAFASPPPVNPYDAWAWIKIPTGSTGAFQCFVDVEFSTHGDVPISSGLVAGAEAFVERFSDGTYAAALHVRAAVDGSTIPVSVPFDAPTYLGQWLKLTCTRLGKGTLSDASGAVIATATVLTTLPDATIGALTITGFADLTGGGTLPSLLLDDLYFTDSPPVVPICRLYPRDDGRGIDGNSRIHPPPKSRRIVGGHL